MPPPPEARPAGQKHDPARRPRRMAEQRAQGRDRGMQGQDAGHRAKAGHTGQRAEGQRAQGTGRGTVGGMVRTGPLGTSLAVSGRSLGGFWAVLAVFGVFLAGFGLFWVDFGLVWGCFWLGLGGLWHMAVEPWPGNPEKKHKNRAEPERSKPTWKGNGHRGSGRMAGWVSVLGLALVLCALVPCFGLGCLALAWLWAVRTQGGMASRLS